MASSIYIYGSLKDYNSYYAGKNDQLLYHIPIVDMYIDKKKIKLFIITNQDNRAKKNIDLSRSIVHVRDSGWVKSMLDEYGHDIQLVQHDKIIFNGVTNNIEFFPKKLRKCDMVQHVDRVIRSSNTILPNKCNIDYDNRFYDFVSDRINLILK